MAQVFCDNHWKCNAHCGTWVHEVRPYGIYKGGIARTLCNNCFQGECQEYGMPEDDGFSYWRKLVNKEC